MRGYGKWKEREWEGEEKGRGKREGDGARPPNILD